MDEHGNRRDLTIRPYRPEDRAAVLALWCEAGLQGPPNQPDIDLGNITRTSGATLFVGEMRGSNSGERSADVRLAATTVAAEDGHRGWIYYVAVQPSLQGQRIGTCMVRHAEAHLAARGVPKMLLLIRHPNTAVRSFYERLGYAAEPCVTMGRWLET